MHSLRLNCSQALGLNSCVRSSQKVKPKGICSDLLANESMDAGEYQDGVLGEELDEGRAIPRKKMVCQPTQEEWDEHMRTQIPFRA